MSRFLSGSLLTLLLLPAVDAAPFAYAGTGAGRLYRVDLGNSSATLIGTSTGVPWSGLALSGSGTLYGYSINTGSLYEVDTDDAAATLIGNPGVFLDSIDFEGSTLMGAYGDLAGTTAFYNINTSTGAATSTGSVASFAFNVGFSALTSNTGFLTYNGGGGGVLWTYDIAGSSVTATGPTFGFDTQAIDVASDGNLYGITAAGVILRFDTGTGAATQIGQITPEFGDSFSALASAPENVPEPGTWILAAVGVMALVVRQRREKKPRALVPSIVSSTPCGPAPRRET